MNSSSLRRCCAARFLLLLLASTLSLPVAADTALAAVASNFARTAELLVQRYQAQAPHTVTLTLGSTGKLYAQVQHGAPYDLLLAADEQRPRLLEASGMAVAGSRFTYAFGQLVLIQAASLPTPLQGAEMLRSGGFTRLAMANPELAPYGLAALETLRALDVLDAVRSRLVFADNVGQVYAMFHTGNVDLAFAAAAQLDSALPQSRRWLVSADLYPAIRQDAVLLQRGADNAAAAGFLQFLQSAEARALIVDQGYQPFEQ